MRSNVGTVLGLKGMAMQSRTLHLQKYSERPRFLTFEWQKNVPCLVEYDEGPQDDIKVSSNTFWKEACSHFEDEYGHNCPQGVAPSKATIFSQLPEDELYENASHWSTRYHSYRKWEEDSYPNQCLYYLQNDCISFFHDRKFFFQHKFDCIDRRFWRIRIATIEWHHLVIIYTILIVAYSYLIQ